ncbi:MAG TPA: hypothetical protein PLJ60_08765 [Chryseolinea sp.]|nr:hypothetical protein [Chryseolinea sp.]
MKKTLSIFIVLIAISSVVNARRLDKPEETSSMAIMKSGSLVKLFYTGVKECNVKVTIFNAENKIMFKEELRQVDRFMRPYNFGELPEGDYTIELVDHTGKKIEKVSYREGKIERLANLLRISGDENRYLLTLSNKGKETLEVKIYNAKGDLLYSHSEDINGDFAKIYDLSRVDEKVSFEITDRSGNTNRMEY